MDHKTIRKQLKLGGQNFQPTLELSPMGENERVNRKSDGNGEANFSSH